MRKSIYQRMFEDSFQEASIEIGKQSTLCGNCFGRLHYHIFWDMIHPMKQYLCKYDEEI
jgi:hypothetical protein